MRVAVAIKVRFFARLREQAGTESESVEVKSGSSVSEVYEALRRRHPSLEPDLKAVRPAVNQQFSEWDAIVSDGDEVAFIPPVSGGCSGAL
ncbi:MAG TPA: molybdopterin converting factor subunit 1 [Candidatus Udaeobacter sp.]|nr:molybdopterin converting factor subunit 1 [Candidatus Udaeobacter sp.]